jgi:hydroxymethylbilane synthase
MDIKNKVFTIVSRQSRLALQQATIVQQQLQALYPELKIQIKAITTSGDEILDRPLNKIGGKGLFVKELEICLLNGQADIAVHSMKDVPAELPSGLELGPVLLRADARDVLLSIKNYTLDSLPKDAVVGTSSLRRQSQILARRADLRLEDLRGNVETRIQKLKDGHYDAIILAAAGLERLALNQWLDCALSFDTMLPAAGQGVLGIEYRSDDLAIKDLVAPLNHGITASCLQAERAMNAKLNGGCQAPIAGFATLENKILTLKGLVGSADGKLIYTAQKSGDPKDAFLIGEQVAEQLIAQGADKIIQDLKCVWQSNE